MIRKCFVLLLALALTSCTLEMIPRPQAPAPTAPAAEPTTAPLTGPAVSPPGLTAIYMLDAQNGWGISDTAVLRTADGGATWHQAGPPSPGQLGYFAVANFPDQVHGWVLTPDPNDMMKGTLQRTSDGGTTWESIPVPFGGGDLHFLDTKHGWMMASLGAGAGSMGVAVYQTEDGGSTWKQAYTNDPNQANSASSLPLGGLKDGISAVNMQAAWIGGVVYAPGTIYLYNTKDGGATWTQIPVKIPDGYEQAEFETRGPLFPTSNTAYLPVTVSSQNGIMMAIYASKDAGATWTLTPTLLPQGGAMDFVSADDGFVWNGANFYVTHDGAQTWASVAPDVAFGESFSGMDFVSTNTGFVVTSDGAGGHGLYKSTDGGATWNILGQ